MSDVGGNTERYDRLSAHVALIEALRERLYHFITPSPATHARVIWRKLVARDLRDVLGWSLPFSRNAIDAEIVSLLNACGALTERDGLLASTLRASTLDDSIFLHSAYPTTSNDAVFFGPDSYRFASFIRAELPHFGPISQLAEIGAGSGVGAVAALRATQIGSLALSDINPRALELAQANLLSDCARGMHGMRVLGGAVEFSAKSGLSGIAGPLNAVIANPPYMADAEKRAYRDGGDMHGAALSLRWAEEAAERLAVGGALLLYTGSAIVDGEDRLKAALEKTLRGFELNYRELDPDVFGEELERADYADVERIAVVGLVAVKR